MAERCSGRLASLAIAAHRKYLRGDGDDDNDAAPLVVSDEDAAWLARAHEGAIPWSKLVRLMADAVLLPAPRSLLAALAGVGLAEALLPPGDLERVLTFPMDTGRTLLHEAVARNDSGVVKLLARLPGAHLSLHDETGRTPLEAAVAGLRVEVVVAWPRSDVERHLRQPAADQPDRPSLWHHLVQGGALLQVASAARQQAALAAAMQIPAIAQLQRLLGSGPPPDIAGAAAGPVACYSSDVAFNMLAAIAKALVGWWRNERRRDDEIAGLERLGAAIEALPQPRDPRIASQQARLKTAYERRLDAKMRPSRDTLQRRAGPLGTPLELALRERIYSACHLFYLVAPRAADSDRRLLDAPDRQSRTLLEASIARNDWDLALALVCDGARICESSAGAGGGGESPLIGERDPICQAVLNLAGQEHLQHARVDTLRALLRRPEGAACAREQRCVRAVPGHPGGARLLHVAVIVRACAPGPEAAPPPAEAAGAASAAALGQMRAAADAMEEALGATQARPLTHVAAQTMIVHAFLMAGADPDVRNGKGESALDLARERQPQQLEPSNAGGGGAGGAGVGDAGDGEIDYATVDVVALLARYSKREREAQAARRAERDAAEEVEAARRAQEEKQQRQSAAPAAPPPARGTSSSQPAAESPSCPASPRAATAPSPTSQPTPESPPPPPPPVVSSPPPPPPPTTPAAPRRLPPHLRLAAARRAALNASSGAPVVPSVAAPAPPHEGDE